MAGFGLSRLEDDTGFTAEEVHINLWVLDGLPFHHRILFEVGLYLKKIPEQAVKLSGFELALPFLISDKESDIVDVSTMLDEQNARLLFGKARISDGRIIWTRFIDEKQLETNATKTRINKDQTDCIDKNPPKDKVSTWRFKLQEDDTKADELYIRIRFHIRESDALWKWHCGITGKNGALFDLNFQDLRALPDFISASRLLPVGKVYTHLIIPQWLETGIMAPTPKNARLFEGKIWERFLNQKLDLLRSGKLFVYSWDKKTVSSESPFRVFGSFRSFPGTPKPAYYVGSVFLIAVCSAGAVWSWSRYIGNAPRFMGDIKIIWTYIATFFGGAGLIAIIRMLSNKINTFKKILNTLKNWYYRLEEFMFRRPSS